MAHGRETTVVKAFWGRICLISHWPLGWHLSNITRNCNAGTSPFAGREPRLAGQTQNRPHQIDSQQPGTKQVLVKNISVT